MNVKSLFRNLTKDRFRFLLNLSGMVLSFTLVLVLLSHALYSLQTDRHIPENEKVAAVTLDKSMLFITYPMEELLERNFPEVESATLVDFVSANSEHILTNEQNRLNANLIAATPGFFNVFKPKVLLGNSSGLLEKPTAIAITESLAQKLFGEENPIGKTLEYEKKQLTVEAVLADVPENSTTQYDAIISFFLRDVDSRGKYYLNNWSSWNYHLFARFGNPGMMDAVAQKLPQVLFDNEITDEPEDYKSSLAVLPLQEVYFNTAIRDYLPHGNRNNVFLMITAAMAVLAVAIMNYINLTTAQSAGRIRSIGIQKMTGASRAQLIRSIISEGCAIALISIIIALAISFVIVSISNKTGYFPMISWLTGSLKGILLVIGMAFTLGLISGIYPALQFTRFNPVKTIKLQTEIKTGGNVLRDVLTVTQFSIAILLIIFTLLVRKQNNFLLNNDPGFNKEQVLYINTYRRTIEMNINVLKDELRKIPEVEYLATVSSTLGDLEEHWGTTINNSRGAEHVSFFAVMAERDYPKVMGFKMTKGEIPEAGRYKEGGVLYINEKAFAEFELEDKDVGTAFIRSNNTGKDTYLCGVFSDFNYHTYDKEIKPFGLFCSDQYTNLGTLALRIKPEGLQNTRALIHRIQGIWDSMETGMPLDYTFLDDHFASMYADEDRFNKAFTVFVALAIFIACLGILGLSAFIAEQRRKEIAIRKVNGATISSVLRLLTGRFVLRIGIAFALAAPAAWYIAGKWLQNYAYHTQPSWYLWLIGLLMAATVALATAWTHTWRAATLNPAKSLKYE